MRPAFHFLALSRLFHRMGARKAWQRAMAEFAQREADARRRHASVRQIQQERQEFVHSHLRGGAA